jgi:hypothetical protein
MATKNLLVRAGADFSSLRTAMKQTQKEAQTFQTVVESSANKAGAAFMAVAAGLTAVAAAFAAASKAGMKFEADVQHINRLLGSSASGFYAWAREQDEALGVGMGAAVKYGATYANLLRTFEKSPEGLRLATQNLIEGMAVISSARNIPIDEVGERIRSGLLGNTEAIEDLGISAQVSVIQMSKAFKELGKGQSWDKIASTNGELAQQIRYYAILEQISANFGTELTQNTGTNLNKFTAQLNDTRTALGLAFLPIINSVLPALTAMARGLATAATYVAQFFSILFGTDTAKKTDSQSKATTKAAGSVGDLGGAYKKAGKEAAGALASFDEIHQVAKESASDADAAAGDGVPSMSVGDLFDPYAITPLDAFAGKLDKLKGRAADLIQPLRDLGDAAKKLGDSIKGFIETPAFQTFIDWIAGKFWDARMGDIKLAEGVLEGWSGFFTILEGIVTLDFAKIIDGIKGSAEGSSKSIGALLDQLGITGDGYLTVNSWWDRTKNQWEWFRDNTKPIWSGVYKEASDEWQALEEFDWSSVGASVKAEWERLKEDTRPLWEGIANAAKTGYKALEEYDWTAVTDAIGTKWDEFKTDAGTKWTAIKDAVGKKWDEIKDEASLKSEGVRILVGAKWDEFKEDASTKWSNIKLAVATKWDEIKTQAGEKGALVKEAVATKWTEIKTQAGTKWNEIKDEVGKKWDAIAKIDWSSVKTAVDTVWNNIKTSAGTIWSQIAAGITGEINKVIRSINTFISRVNSISINIPEIKNPLNGETLLGGFSIGVPRIPTIPELARGGFVGSATNFGNYVAGEAGSELVMPLENTSFVDRIASALGTAVMNAMQMGSTGQQTGGRASGDVVMTINGTEFARVVAPYLNGENTRQGVSLITGRG